MNNFKRLSSFCRWQINKSPEPLIVKQGKKCLGPNHMDFELTVQAEEQIPTPDSHQDGRCCSTATTPHPFSFKVQYVVIQRDVWTQNVGRL